MPTPPPSPFTNERVSTEKLLAAAICATTDFRVRFAERPGVNMGAGPISQAIRYAVDRGFSVRELACWLQENGVRISPAQIFRKSEQGFSPSRDADNWVEAFQRLEDAVRWVQGLCHLSVDSTIVFVNAILGCSAGPGSAPISADTLLEASPQAVRAAAAEAVGVYLDGVKLGKWPLYASDVAHIDVLQYAARAEDSEIALLLKIAQQIHRRPHASVGIRKLRECST